MNRYITENKYNPPITMEKSLTLLENREIN